MLKHFLITCSIIACVSAVPTGRIVGGDYAAIGQFPHQVALLTRGNSLICGGSIINERYILTAAHCVIGWTGKPDPPEAFVVRVGSNQYNASGEVHDIEQVIVHEQYGNFLNDVTLLVTTKPIAFNDNVKSIKLASQEVPAGSNVIISGWGRTANNAPASTDLKWNTLNAITTEECDNAIGMGEESLLCLSHKKNNGACNGDSGGPAVYDNEVVGIAGFVVNGCGSTYPDGYAKVYYHKNWILNQMEKYSKNNL